MATAAARAGLAYPAVSCPASVSASLKGKQSRVAFAPLNHNQSSKQVFSASAGSISGTPLTAPSSRATKRAIRRRSGEAAPRAAAQDGELTPENKLAPLTPVSPAGQLLIQLLHSHPHLFTPAAEQQLERLAEDKSAQQEQASTSGTDLVLYKRINEVKEAERKCAIEDIMYACIVQKFVDSDVELVAKIPTASESNGQGVNVGALKFRVLEAVHSPEALEMVREHIQMVLGGRAEASMVDDHVMAQISKLRVGQVYAASVMYGYFLRRVDQRFQLDKRMRAALGEGASDAEVVPEVRPEPEARPKPEVVSASGEGDRLAAELTAAAAKMAARRPEFEVVSEVASTSGGSTKASALRAYVMGFDQETLQRSATMRSRESINVIERHTEALFGKPEIIVLEDGRLAVKQTDDAVRISFGGLRKLVLEAVAFGSYLWDVETFVDEQYGLVASS